jgi:hypothetical protein
MTCYDYVKDLIVIISAVGDNELKADFKHVHSLLENDIHLVIILRLLHLVRVINCGCMDTILRIIFI